MSEYLYIMGVPGFANYEASCSLLRIPKGGGGIDYVCIGEDRLTRLKHTYLFPLRGIHYCLRHFGLEALEQVDYIATDYARIPRWTNNGPAYRKVEHDYLKGMLKYPRERILICDHHDAHAASCYYPSGFPEAGVLIIDGMGSELNTQTAYHFQGDTLTWCERGYDWGIGRLYSLVTGAILPYGPEKGYGKVMGLAPYGAAHQEVGLDFGARNDGITSDYSHFFTRYPISRLIAPEAPACTDREGIMEPPYPRIAYEVQQECEAQVVRLAQYIHEKTGTKRLCIAGGVALNGRGNFRILENTPIEEVWIQPACSDTGISLGAALWAAFQELPGLDVYRKNTVPMRHAYCGSPYDNDETLELLDRHQIKHRPVTDEEVAQRLVEGYVVAVFEGGSEYGPRALGHRSILADPRNPDTKDLLNRSIKFREGYRPYAPVVLREYASEYFNLDCDSPFMLLVADVREEKRSVIPSVTHVDGTARVQTVTEEDNGNFYGILKHFHALTGVPVLLNTSFNVNREPIVETPLDALICAFGSSIDCLVIDGHLVECQAYRDGDLVKTLRTNREVDLEAQHRELTEKYLYQYIPDEMETYLVEQNLIADWYRNYRAKYELERAMIRWKTENKKVLIVGTRNHTKCLYLYIPEFPILAVRGFVPCDAFPGERGDFDGVYDEYALEEVNWAEVDEILISTHEYQRKVTELVNKHAAPGTRVLQIYDTACDSLIYTLPGKWPVMNPHEANRVGLSMEATRQRTASNIDFDFEPASIDIGERYAVAINHHFVRPVNQTGAYRVRAHLTPKRFEQQIKALQEHFAFGRCKDLVNPNSDLPESAVLLTFDDGARDVIDFAVPILKKQGISASVYVASRPYLENRLLDVQKIEFLISRLGFEPFRLGFGEELKRLFPNGAERESIAYAGDYRFYRYDNDEIRQFKLDLNYRLPYSQVTTVLERMFEATFGKDSQQEAVREVYLGRDDLLRLMDDGFELGLHTHNHKVLPRLDLKSQRQEVSTALEFLKDLTGEQSFSVAFPFGFYNNDTKRVMKELGLVVGMSMERRLITPGEIQARWSLPRYDVNDCFDKTGAINYQVFSNMSTGD